MSTVRFITEIGQDHIIHTPPNVHLTPGTAEIIVVQPVGAAEERGAAQTIPGMVPKIAEKLSQFARHQNAALLPTDYAINHDHYLHGAPKRIDQP